MLVLAPSTKIAPPSSFATHMEIEVEEMFVFTPSI